MQPLAKLFRATIAPRLVRKLGATASGATVPVSPSAKATATAQRLSSSSSTSSAANCSPAIKSEGRVPGGPPIGRRPGSSSTRTARPRSPGQSTGSVRRQPKLEASSTSAASAASSKSPDGARTGPLPRSADLFLHRPRESGAGLDELRRLCLAEGAVSFTSVPVPGAGFGASLARFKSDSAATKAWRNLRQVVALDPELCAVEVHFGRDNRRPLPPVRPPTPPTVGRIAIIRKSSIWETKQELLELMRPCVPSTVEIGCWNPRLAFATFPNEAEAARACDVVTVNASGTGDIDVEAWFIESVHSACQRMGIPEAQLLQLDSNLPRTSSEIQSAAKRMLYRTFTDLSYPFPTVLKSFDPEHESWTRTVYLAFETPEATEEAAQNAELYVEAAIYTIQRVVTAVDSSPDPNPPSVAETVSASLDVNDGIEPRLPETKPLAANGLTEVPPGRPVSFETSNLHVSGLEGLPESVVEDALAELLDEDQECAVQWPGGSSGEHALVQFGSIEEAKRFKAAAEDLLVEGRVLKVAYYG